METLDSKANRHLDRLDEIVTKLSLDRDFGTEGRRLLAGSARVRIAALREVVSLYEENLDLYSSQS